MNNLNAIRQNRSKDQDNKLDGKSHEDCDDDLDDIFIDEVIDLVDASLRLRSYLRWRGVVNGRRGDGEDAGGEVRPVGVVVEAAALELLLKVFAGLVGGRIPRLVGKLYCLIFECNSDDPHNKLCDEDDGNTDDKLYIIYCVFVV